jgi:CheY-like chemotaxis protein
MSIRLPDTPAITHPIILVVDDEPLYLEFIADSLGAGYKILCATDGIAALRIAFSEIGRLG